MSEISSETTCTDCSFSDLTRKEYNYMATENIASSRQTESAIEKNMGFFEKDPYYKKYTSEFDVYKYSSLTVNQTIDGVKELLDVGNGGLINYDASKAGSIVALDLFLEEGRKSEYPNVKFQNGSALAMPFDSNRFDMVLMQNLLHHVIGDSVGESKELLRKVLKESYRVLKPGGRLLIIESTIPSWFYFIEAALFPLFLRLNPLKHPATFQYTAEQIRKRAEIEGFSLLEYLYIPKGKYIIQLGFKFPSALTPVRVMKLLLLKSAR